MAHSKVRIVNSVQEALQRSGVSGDDSILVAVSGGVDSVVLSDILHNLYKKKYFKRLAIAHLNHQLRGKDADKDAAFVVSFAKKLGLEYFGESADVNVFAAKN